MKKSNLPLIVIRAVKDLYTVIRNYVEKNGDIIFKAEDTPFILRIEDKEINSDFFYEISNPRYESSKVIFTVKFGPSNINSIKAGTFHFDQASSLDYFYKWCDYIREYHNTILTPEEEVISGYEEEFYYNFEIIDDDADKIAYDLPTQIVINNFLVASVDFLGNDSSNQYLAEEAESLRKDLSQLSKKETIERLSRFFAKVRYKSLALLKEIFDLGKKELFKKALNQGFDFIGDLLT